MKNFSRKVSWKRYLAVFFVLTLLAASAGCSKGGASNGNAAQSPAGGENRAESTVDQDEESILSPESQEKTPQDTPDASDETDATEPLESGNRQSSEPEDNAGNGPGSDTEVGAVFHLDLLDDKGLGDFDDSRVKEIIMDSYGSSFVFWTEKTLTDLRLIAVEYNGDQFLEGKIFCSYDEFTKDDAILLTHDFPESMPDVKIEFYDEQGQRQLFYISQSGMDASPVLITEEALLFGN